MPSKVKREKIVHDRPRVDAPADLVILRHYPNDTARPYRFAKEIQSAINRKRLTAADQKELEEFCAKRIIESTHPALKKEMKGAATLYSVPPAEFNSFRQEVFPSG